jgi:Tol biopolymer transport system component
VCDVTTPFGTPRAVTELDSSSGQANATLTSDERVVYFASNRESTGADFDIFVATRSALTDPFSSPARVDVLSTTSDDRGTSISPDGLRIYFHSSRSGEYHIWTAAKPDLQSSFASPSMVDGVNQTGAGDEDPWIVANGQVLYFTSNRSSSAGNIYRSTLGPAGFQTPTILRELGNAAAPVLTDDELVIYFAALGPGVDAGGNDFDIWMARRSAVTDGFGTPIPVTELNSHPGYEFPSWLSMDRCRIYFMRGYQIYMAERAP